MRVCILCTYEKDNANSLGAALEDGNGAYALMKGHVENVDNAAGRRQAHVHQ